VYDFGMATQPRVFTIPASAPFLRTLIDALAAGRLVEGFHPGGDPLALAAATIYLPTRRACRLAREMFLEVLDCDAAILPRIVAIGDVDEDEIIFAEAATGEIAGMALDLPDAPGQRGAVEPVEAEHDPQQAEVRHPHAEHDHAPAGAGQLAPIDLATKVDGEDRAHALLVMRPSACANCGPLDGRSPPRGGPLKASSGSNSRTGSPSSSPSLAYSPGSRADPPETEIRSGSGSRPWVR